MKKAVTIPTFALMSVMAQRYLKTILFFSLFASAVVAKAQQELYPFEDYQYCKTGYARLNTTTRLPDTIFPAKFENAVEQHYSIDYLRQAQNYRYWIVSENGKYGCLCSNGKWLLECIYDTLSFEGNSSQFIAKRNGKTGTILPNLEIGFPFEYDEISTEYPVYIRFENSIYPFNFVKELFVRKNNLLGVWLPNGDMLIAPQFDSIQSLVWEEGYRERGEMVIPEKRFYRVKKNNKVGLYNAAGQPIFAPRYKSLDVFVDRQPTEYVQLFLVTDALDRYSVINEFGKELVPFSKLKYESLNTLRTVQQEKSPQYVLEDDQKRKKQRISSLVTGTSSEWYAHVNFVGNYILARSSKKYVVLDTNFQVIYQQKTPHEQLMYFSDYVGLDSAKNFPRNYDELYYTSESRDHTPLPHVFALEAKLKNQRSYSLVDLSTGVLWAGTYTKIVRITENGINYYWCINSVKDSIRKDIAFSADVFNDSGVLVNQLQLDAFEEENITWYGRYNWVDERMELFMPVRKVNGKYTLFGMDGWQPKTHEFDDQVQCMKKGNVGYLCFTDKDGKQYFTDLNGKPLLDGKRFRFGGRNVQLRLGILPLVDDDGITQFVDQQLTILLDSCEVVKYDVEDSKIDPKGGNYGYGDYRTFPIRNGYVYVILLDSIKLVDAKMFTNPNGMNEIVRGFYVTDSGKKWTDQEVRKYQQAQKKTDDYNNYWLVNNQFKIENKRTGMVRIIPDIEEYQLHYSTHPIKLITTSGKQGLLTSYNAEWLLKPLYEEVQVIGDQNLGFLVRDSSLTKNGWWIVDGNGKQLTKSVFDESFYLNSTAKWTFAQSDSLLGTLGTNFEWLTEPKYLGLRDLRNDMLVLNATDHSAIVDRETGKSFRTTRDTIAETNYRYFFFFNDSVQIINRDGVEVLPPIKLSEAIATKNLYQCLYNDYYVYDEYVPPTNHASGYAIRFTDSSTFLRQLSNRFIIDNAQYKAISIKQYGSQYVYTNKNANVYHDEICLRYSLSVSEYLYSEKVSGTCFDHPEYMPGTNQKYSFRTYWIKNDSLIPVQGLSDLFIDGVAYESRLNELIAEQIQTRQIFGMACTNLPAAVEEFKRNFYIGEYGLSFCYYDNSDVIHIYVDPNELKDVLKAEVW